MRHRSLLCLGMLVASLVYVSDTSAEVEPAVVRAWLFADQPATEHYVPRLYLTTGIFGTGVTRFGEGRYLVEFGGLGTPGGMVQVTAVGDNRHCKVEQWGFQTRSDGFPGSLSVWVRCFKPDGQLSDSKFNVLFYKENRPLASNANAYLWANEPNIAIKKPYIPRPDYQWNSKSLTNTVQRLGTGYYEATLPGLNTSGGTVLVTAYGVGPERCKVADWSRHDTATVVSVRCFDSIGAAVNTPFTLSFMTDVLLGTELTLVDHDVLGGGFVWASNPAEMDYIPPLTRQYTTIEEAISIHLISTGQYRVHIPGLFPLLPNPSLTDTALATASGVGNGYCVIQRWSLSADPDVFVNCFDTNGRPSATQFTLTYLVNYFGSVD